MGKKVAVLGATGAVGQEFLRLFEQRDFPISDLVLLASPRSAGQKQSFRDQDWTIQAASNDAFSGVDYAFFSAGASRSREFAQPAIDAGATVIDNSSAFRMAEGIPLVIPEVNLDSVTAEDKLIANPNCTAMILVMAIGPIHRRWPIERLIVSTYQSASGAGYAAMQELENQSKDVLSGQPAKLEIFPHPIAFNLFSHNTAIGEDGFNEEEQKVIEETKKILDAPSLKINVTCVRVPVMRAHCESVTMEFVDKVPTEDEMREVWNSSPGVRLVDDRENNTFPMPVLASGQDDVLVGRIRRDPSHSKAMSIFIAGDQLLKGAALNAVQIAEALIKQGR